MKKFLQRHIAAVIAAALILGIILAVSVLSQWAEHGEIGFEQIVSAVVFYVLVPPVMAAALICDIPKQAGE